MGKTFRTGEVEVAALSDLTLGIRDREILVVLGPSGSGKSTLLHLVGAMARPTQGRIRYRGEDLGGASDAARTEYRRRRVGFVFQFYNLIPTLTAEENVEAAAEIADRPLDPREVLAEVGLGDRFGHFPAQLSGGEQQRVAVARALVSQPELLLCDEPTGALDLATSRVVLGILVRSARELGKGVVVITHNVALAGIADRVASLRDGRLVSLRENPEPRAVGSISW